MYGWVFYARQCRQICRKIVVYQQRNPELSRCVRVSRGNVALVNQYLHRSMSQQPNKFEALRPGTKPKDEQSSPETSDDLSKKTGRQKLSLVFAKYGVTAVVFHTLISLTSLGLCYIAVSSGLDIPGFLMKVGASESFSTSVAAKGASTFVIAYACHKIFMPVRIFLTVTFTPVIVFRLQRLGLLKAR